MLSLIFLYFRKQDYRTRLLAGVSVLAMAIAIFALAFFKFFIYSPLARYASADTVFYLHLKLSKQGNYYQTGIINSIADHFQLENFDHHYPKKEIAVICGKDPADCHFIFFAENKKISERYFQENKISYKLSDGNVFFIPLSRKEQAKPKKTWNPLVYLRYQGWSPANDMILSLSQNRQPQTADQKILAFMDNGTRLAGRTSNQGIIMGAKGVSISNADWQKINEKIERNQFDILINLTPKSHFNESLANYLDSFKMIQGGQTMQLLSQAGFSLFMNRNNSDSQNLLDSYAIFMNLHNIPSADSLERLKSTISGISASILPREKNLYLNDGTKVTILSYAEKLPLIQSGEYLESPIGNDSNIFLKLATSTVSIGNDRNFQPTTEDKGSDYCLIKISRLPALNPIRKYLENFSFLYFDQQKIIIK